MSVKDDPLVVAVLQRFGGSEITDVRLAPLDDADAALALPVEGPRLFSLGDIRKTLIDASDCIRATQTALVTMGDRSEPHAGELLRAKHFEAAAALIDRCKTDAMIMERLKRGPGK